MTEVKTHWKKLVNPQYIGAYSLDPGQDLVVTIEKVVREMVQGPDGKKEECTVAYLVNQKPFILNSTNSKNIAKVAGSSYIEDWAGKSVTLYVAKVKAFGEVVDALRVRPEPPVIKLPELTPSHAKWNGAVKALKDGNTTLNVIKSKFIVSAENEALLVNEASNA